ncbi:hypothetical protein [Celeribacter indicus]|uniref:SnoaL-like domain-containing protein n=1 Tax=Celeribacter indicus TaxID=1208324 RepID=A0A0B5DYI1_9RHOB|nr:hypothetical protein [Celeribacter indicus]AJE46215.1 hypothetical protein P73_1500 [Celeribacter indicus]SDW50183.1 hypothetical protein SAMN05443573_10448 [Celeribacter indicus]
MAGKTRVTLPAGCENAPRNARAVEIALAFMGVARLEPDLLAEGASWDRTGAPCLIGRGAISDAVAQVTPPVSLSVSEVSTHGRAGSVSGRFTRDGEGTSLFCHVLRFTSASCRELAQVVSFERRERA